MYLHHHSYAETQLQCTNLGFLHALKIHFLQHCQGYHPGLVALLTQVDQHHLVVLPALL